MNIADHIKEAIAQQCGEPVDKITEGTKLYDLSGFDSLDRYELAMQLEEDFDIEIPDEDVQKFTTVQFVIDYVTAKAASGVAAPG